MKISYKGDYALKIVLDLAHNYPGNLAHIEDIAKRRDIPQNYLEQILLMLKKGGFVQSKKGPNGGYFLARLPKEISVGEVVRFMEGSVYPISCVDPKAIRTCNETKSCAFYEIWKKVGDAITGIVDNINFEQLKAKEKKIKAGGAVHYYI